MSPTSGHQDVSQSITREFDMRRYTIAILLLLLATLSFSVSAFGEIAQTRAAHLPPASDSLWKFLAALPNTMEAQVFYGLLLSGTIGMAAHYFTRWAKGEIQGSLFAYLFDSYARRTSLALTVIVGMAITAITSNVFVTESGEFVGWLNVLWFGITNGYASDSIANKGQPSPTKE